MHGWPRSANTRVSLDHLIIHCVGVLFYLAWSVFSFVVFCCCFYKRGGGAGLGENWRTFDGDEYDDNDDSEEEVEEEGCFKHTTPQTTSFGVRQPSSRRAVGKQGLECGSARVCRQKPWNYNYIGPCTNRSRRQRVALEALADMLSLTTSVPRCGDQGVWLLG